MDALKLTRTDFDSMENHNPRSAKTVCIFTPSKGKSAYGVAADWFSKQPPEKLYVGHDNVVYPQFKLESIKVIGGD